MSDEEKRFKKQKIEDNRRLRVMSQSLSMLTTGSDSPSISNSQFHFEHSINNDDDDDDDDFKHSLNINQRISLTKIEEHYIQAVRLNISVIPGYSSPCLRNLSDIVSCLNEPAYISSLRLITFLKLTPQFQVRSIFQT